MKIIPNCHPGEQKPKMFFLNFILSLSLQEVLGGSLMYDNRVARTA